MEAGDKLYLTEGHKCADCVFNDLCDLLCRTYDNDVSSTIDGFVPECKMVEGLIYKVIKEE